jgi:Ca-activated chloride channel homolog
MFRNRVLHRVSWLLVLLAWSGCTNTSSDGAASKKATDGRGEEGTRSLGTGDDLGAGGTAGTGAQDGFTEGGGLSASAGTTASGVAYDAAYEPSASNDGDKYESVGVNPFTVVAHDPFSTFAADVDTASYDIFRRDVNLNLIPQAGSVRLEDFVNYFRYDYPAPQESAEHPFAISLAAVGNPLGRATTLLRVGIQAQKPPASEKKPASIVFLIDTSGSMQTEEKLPLVQHLLTETLNVLDADDTVSIVTYAGDTSVRLPPTPVAHRSVIEAEINGLDAGGSTAGAAGLTLAYEQAAAGFINDGINHVVLCTDGDFNVGPSSDEELVQLIEEKRKTGITLTALGFGIGNLNDAMMEKVSNAGNGIYSVIASKTQATSYAEDKMLATLVHVAKDMKLQVEFNPETVRAYRLLGYENRAIADDDFRDDMVDAGEVGAGHRVTALYELVLAGDDIPMPEEGPEIVDGEAVEGKREIAAEDLVLVKVRYKAPGATEEDAAYEVSATLAPSAIAEVGDDDVRWAVAMAAFAEFLKGSPFARDEDLEVIGAIVQAQKDRDLERTEFAELFAKALTLLGKD